MHFAQPLLGGLALLAVPIILLMYLLKQKYKEKQVPSLYLWEKVLTQTKAQEAMAEAAEKPADVFARSRRLSFLHLLCPALISWGKYRCGITSLVWTAL